MLVITSCKINLDSNGLTKLCIAYFTIYSSIPSIDESHRPVRLRRVVLGYPNANSEFKFDLSLNYRLSSVIQCYSDQKPTLVVSEMSMRNGGPKLIIS